MIRSKLDKCHFSIKLYHRSLSNIFFEKIRYFWNKKKLNLKKKWSKATMMRLCLNVKNTTVYCRIFKVDLASQSRSSGSVLKWFLKNGVSADILGAKEPNNRKFNFRVIQRKSDTLRNWVSELSHVVKWSSSINWPRHQFV